MPMPNFMRHVNKRVFNPREVAKGQRPVLDHVGRTSGRNHRTPVAAYEVDGGYVFVLMYGAEATDWVKNIQASGRAGLTAGGEHHELVNPRVLTGDRAWAELPDGADRPPRFLKVDEVLRMDLEAA